MQYAKKVWLKEKNRGSAVIEVTLLMPLILLIMTVLLTMLLGGLKQAEIHSGLMHYSLSNEQSLNSPEIEVSNKADKVIYTQVAGLTLVPGYEMLSKEQQVARVSHVEEHLRRWQLLGNIASEGGLSPVCNLSDQPQ